MSNPKDGTLGLSLDWLRRLLRESPIRQQIILLDCCYSGEFLMFNEQVFKQADPGERGKGLDRCFITASREYEEAWEEIHGEHSVLTSLLLKGLDPSATDTGAVDNYSLADFIKQEISGKIQRPLFSNSGSKILLTGRTAASIHSAQENVCPYKGLQYFDYEGDDPKYFFGRETLTDELIDKVKNSRFVAVLGASGSGKSSLVRAGLLYQLQQGKKLAGSELWPEPVILRPGAQPLHNLADATGIPIADLQANPDALANWIQTLLNAPDFRQKSDALRPRQIILIDQFEELFTLCQDIDIDQRLAFLKSVLGTLDNFSQSADNTDKLCLVLTMRADFLGRCAEHDYLGLAKRIEQNLVTATPMREEDLRRAILLPAEEVGLEVEGNLVDEMMADVAEAPGSLPLLQYTLKALWENRLLNRLTLSSYRDSGGIEGTLASRADSVYAELSKDEQGIARNLFLELIQPGEGSEDTRRQVAKNQLLTASGSEPVLQHLTNAGLLITSEVISKGDNPQRIAVADVAHEALIRHWPRLRQWLDAYRDALRLKRKIEAEAEDWQRHEEHTDYLLHGTRLNTAESYQEEQANQIPLSPLALCLIEASRTERDRLSSEEDARRVKELEDAKKLAEAEKQARTQAEEKEKAANYKRRAIFVGLLASILLAVLSIFFAWKANSNSKLATQKAKLADHSKKQADLAAYTANLNYSRMIASTSLKEMEKGNISDALLLALDAFPYGGRKDSIFLPENERALHTVLLNWHELFSINLDNLRFVSFSNNGEFFITTSVDKDTNAIVFDTKTGKEILKTPIYKDKSFSKPTFAFTNDSLKVIVPSDDSKAYLWDIKRGVKIKEYTAPNSGSKFEKVYLSSDENYILLSSKDVLFLFDFKNAKFIRYFKGNLGKFSPDGKQIAVVYKDIISIWGEDDDKPNFMLAGHTDEVNDISFSPDNKFLVSAFKDKTAIVWDITTGKIKNTLNGHTSNINSIDYSPDGNLIVTASWDDTAKIWNATTGTEVKTLKHTDTIWHTDFSPSGKYILTASSDKTVRVWDRKGTLLYTLFGHKGTVFYASFSPDEQYIGMGIK